MSRLLSRVTGTLVLLLLLVACASVGFQPLTVEQVISLHEGGASEVELIERIQTSGTIYRLSARQAETLRSDTGLPESVVSAMEQTFADAVANDPTLNDWDRYWFRDDGYWYGDCPLARAGVLSLGCG